MVAWWPNSCHRGRCTPRRRRRWHASSRPASPSLRRTLTAGQTNGPTSAFRAGPRLDSSTRTVAKRRAARGVAHRPLRSDVGPADTVEVRYVESSALLAALLERDAEARRALRADQPLATSALTLAEAYRGILRARAAGRLTDIEERRAVRAVQRFGRRCFVIDVTSDVLSRAGRRFPVEPVRTLDAVHLATLELVGGPPALLAVVTRDTRVRENATALGYHVE